MINGANKPDNVASSFPIWGRSSRAASHGLGGRTEGRALQNDKIQRLIKDERGEDSSCSRGVFTKRPQSVLVAEDLHSHQRHAHASLTLKRRPV